MDTSKEFILMCRQAGEVQRLWKPAAGDWYVHDYRGSTGTNREFEQRIWGDDDKTWNRVEILAYRPSSSKDCWITAGEDSGVVSAADLVKGQCIWLPRQDQLQEIAQAYPNVSKQLMQEFATFIDYLKHTSSPVYDSYEQLWLVFTMLQEHKVWSGKDWVLERKV